MQGEAGVRFPAASAGFGSISSETESVFEQKQTSSAENGYCISSKSIVLYSSVLIYSSLIEYLRQHQFLAGTWPISNQLIPKRAKHRILNANAGQDHRPTENEVGPSSEADTGTARTRSAGNRAGWSRQMLRGWLCAAAASSGVTLKNKPLPGWLKQPPRKQ